VTYRVVIADDEPLARKKLRKLLAPVEWLELVDEAADGPATIEAVNRLKPDLLFLDIRMPGASGLEVLERIEPGPHVIFTTAYDKYAVAAFELQALDYLLKPFGPERLERALARAQAALEAGEVRGSTEERARRALGERRPLTRLFVRERRLRGRARGRAPIPGAGQAEGFRGDARPGQLRPSSPLAHREPRARERAEAL
jgi:two-component system LytT family response regulator